MLRLNIGSGAADACSALAQGPCANKARGVRTLASNGLGSWANAEHASAEPEPVFSLSMTVLAKSSPRSDESPQGQMIHLSWAHHLTLCISLPNPSRLSTGHGQPGHQLLNSIGQPLTSIGRTPHFCWQDFCGPWPQVAQIHRWPKSWTWATHYLGQVTVPLRHPPCLPCARDWGWTRAPGRVKNLS